jgi:hypothetical protein
MVEDTGDLLLDRERLVHNFRKPQRRDDIGHPAFVKTPRLADDAGDIVEGTDRHTPKMEALPADPPGFPLWFDKRDLFSCRCEP